MESSLASQDRGVFDARYLAFLETVSHLRPRLHRYCARMTGSVLDGEDVVQDALFQAYRKLDTFEEGRPLGPWLFRIAHNQCIDFLRHQRVRQSAEAESATSETVDPVEPTSPGVGRAIEHLVLSLPPKERACVLLKDVFDYSLEEVADLVDSTVGGVKAALSRGRSKLAALPHRPPSTPRNANPANAQLLNQYVERFNRRDWDGLRELIAADARVTVADRYAGSVAGAPYFDNYRKRSGLWRMVVGEMEGELVVLVLRAEAGASKVHAVVRVEHTGDRIVGIADYTHCPWVIASAQTRVVSGT